MFAEGRATAAFSTALLRTYQATQHAVCLQCLGGWCTKGTRPSERERMKRGLSTRKTEINESKIWIQAKIFATLRFS